MSLKVRDLKAFLEATDDDVEVRLELMFPSEVGGEEIWDSIGSIPIDHAEDEDVGSIVLRGYKDK